MTKTKERPILFSGPMVRALLLGNKTQTRRLINPQPRCSTGTNPICCSGVRINGDAFAVHVRLADDRVVWLDCPYGKVGDRLWVRETWLPLPEGSERAYLYQATDALRVDGHGRWYGARDLANSGGLGVPVTALLPAPAPRWRPSIHMPRSASRLTLVVTAIRAERLQSLSEEDARAEGMDWASPQYCPEDDDREDPRQVGYPSPGASWARDNFRRLWDQLYGKRASWHSDPWVWVVSFRRLEAA